MTTARVLCGEQIAPRQLKQQRADGAHDDPADQRQRDAAGDEDRQRPLVDDRGDRDAEGDGHQAEHERVEDGGGAAHDVRFSARVMEYPVERLGDRERRQRFTRNPNCIEPGWSPEPAWRPDPDVIIIIIVI